MWCITWCCGVVVLRCGDGALREGSQCSGITGDYRWALCVEGLFSHFYEELYLFIVTDLMEQFSLFNI